MMQVLVEDASEELLIQNGASLKLNGAGRLTLKSGAVYEGLFLDGSMHGQGKLVFPDGVEYEGDFKGGAMEGTGVRGLQGCGAL